MHESAAQEERDTSRLEAFSDGVFAIAITLLVLELKVPKTEESAHLGRALLAQWPAYLAFLTSFATIGIMWINHHTLFRLIRRVDHGLLVWNGLLLLGVTVVPFPTALVAEHLGGAGEKVAVLVYCGMYLFVAIAFNGLWRYASAPDRKPRLLRVPHTDPAVLEIHARYRFGPAIYAAAMFAAWLSPPTAVAITLALAVFFALPHRSDAAR